MASACIFVSPLLAEGDPEIPKGVVYKAADAKINAEAQRLIAEVLLAPSPEGVSSKPPAGPTICGPFLWKRIQGDSRVADVRKNGIVATVAVPPEKKEGGEGISAEGRAIRHAEHLPGFWAAVSERYFEGKDIRLRKLSTEELRIYWAMISFDIEEPVFIAESKGVRLLLQTNRENMAKGELSIFWVEDLQGLTPEFLREGMERLNKRESQKWELMITGLCPRESMTIQLSDGVPVGMTLENSEGTYKVQATMKSSAEGNCLVEIAATVRQGNWEKRLATQVALEEDEEVVLGKLEDSDQSFEVKVRLKKIPSGVNEAAPKEAGQK